jgi:hypothetical protein
MILKRLKIEKIKFLTLGLVSSSTESVLQTLTLRTGSLSYTKAAVTASRFDLTTAVLGHRS